jgi:Ca-activated chloride channel family protein
VSFARSRLAAVICVIGLLGWANVALAQRAPWPPAGANDPAAPDPVARNYYVVLDGSGSMVERSCDGNGFKMAQAREALIGFASALPKGANVGLLVFDARGIREVVPLGGPDREPFLRAVRAASPGGLTPLRSAITMARARMEQQARRQLGYGEYHLVVVTDGEASRDEDPRSVVDSIIATTPIVLHTIGFCIDARHSLNQPGRILYRQANDLEGLRKGLQDVLAEAPSFTVQQFGTVAPGKAGR